MLISTQTDAKTNSTDKTVYYLSCKTVQNIFTVILVLQYHGNKLVHWIISLHFKKKCSQ